MAWLLCWHRFLRHRRATDSRELTPPMAGLQHTMIALTAAAALLAAMPAARAQDATPAAAPADAAAVAADSAAQSVWTQKYPAFADFEKSGGMVEYLGRSGSLESFVLLGADKSVKTVYVTPENTMVMGILVDAEGRNMTAPQLLAYRKRLTGDQSAVPGAEKGTMSKAEQVYAGVEKSAWIKAGSDDAPYIYMFMNVNCDHCKAMFMDVAPLIKAGKLQVRLVPFGATTTNREGGAALLSSADAFVAWQAYINGDKEVLGKDKIAAGTLEKIDANTAFATSNKLQGPPFSIYRRPADGVITAMVGRPKNTLALMADLLPPDLPVAPVAPATPAAAPSESASDATPATGGAP